MVVIAFPCERTARVRHEFTRRPSTWTVQAPQAPRSQPFFVPVRSKMLAQSVEQGDPWLDRQWMSLSVHLEHDVDHVLRPHRLGHCRARGDRPGGQPACDCGRTA